MRKEIDDLRAVNKELLEALKGLMRSVEKNGHANWTVADQINLARSYDKSVAVVRKCEDENRAAIAKARGRQL